MTRQIAQFVGDLASGQVTRLECSPTENQKLLISPNTPDEIGQLDYQ